uniref:ceramidase n=2 Tax=Hirondellea gigas TaxID=1518452 RepID=A0A2P2HY28_9CRUS
MLRLSAVTTALLLCGCTFVQPNVFTHNRGGDSFTSKVNVKPFYGCETAAYPPNNSDAVPHYTINLDLQPEQRWQQLVSDNKKQLLQLVGYVFNLTEELVGHEVFSFLLRNLGKLGSSLPEPYQQEMQGIASASGLSMAEVTLYNIFYELIAFCTSIVVQDNAGRVYHGRNLDFGIFMGWNRSSHEWSVAELLRPLVVDLTWSSGGETLYSSVNYVGYVGVITAVKKGAFSFSLDQRFSWNGGFVGLLEWILFDDHQQSWVAFLSRDVMEHAGSYEEAKQMLSSTRLIAPVYFILAGTQPRQGCVITRYRDGYDTVSLNSSSWFLVQTNYDHWKQPPIYDDRRTPAVTCLNKGRHLLLADATDRYKRSIPTFGDNNNTRNMQHVNSVPSSRTDTGLQRKIKILAYLKNNYFSTDYENSGKISAHHNNYEKSASDKKHHLQSEVETMSRYFYDGTKGSSSSTGRGDSSGGPEASYSLLYNVLSTRPVLNKLTTYTSLMSAEDGTLKTWLRVCQDPCWPW